MNKKPLTLLIAALCVHQAAAQEALAPITVSASREDHALQDLASNAAVVGKKDIAEKQALSLGDALRATPGVDMDGVGRYGETDVTIRGVGQNRVKITLDGLPIADSFSFGPYQNAGRAYFDTSNLSQVEVIRGPVSSLHGANALGGVVNLVTRNPNDFIKEGKTFGGEITGEYLGKNNAKRIGATGAFTTDRGVSGLVSYAFTNHDEVQKSGNDVEGTKRTVPNPLDANIHSLSGKVIYQANENHTFSFNASLFRDQQDANILSKRSPQYAASEPPPKGSHRPVLLFTDRVNQTADDWQERKAASVTHDFALDSSFADGGYWRAYAQQQEAEQTTHIDETVRFKFRGFVPPNLPLVHSDHINAFKTRDVGIDLQLDKTFDSGSLNHELLYGASFNHRSVSTTQKELRTFDTGQPSQSSLKKHGPDSTVDSLGIFVQDRITFGETGLSVIPGIRYDHYSLTPKEDATYRATVGKDFVTRDYNTHRISPRLGLLYKFDDSNTLYANYSEGFRAPAFNETNFGFANYDRGYSLIANPDLKPETSRGIEAGWRFNNGTWAHTLTGFYNRYHNFIELYTGSSAPNPVTGLVEFQNRNSPNVNIYGVEWSSDWRVADGLTLQTAISYAKGRAQDDTPINSIDPVNGLISVNYDAPSEVWGAGATFRASAAKKAADIDSGTGRNKLLPSAGYGTLDLTAYYRPIKDLTIRGGVYNVFDKEYISWSNARAMKGMTAEQDRKTYGAPERWFGASFRYEF